MKKPYFTRKDLIVIALSIFYSLFLMFVGACLVPLDGISKKNPILSLGNEFFGQTAPATTTSFVAIILVAIYVTVFVASILYEVRYANNNNKSLKSPKMILTYILTLLACLVLSVGIGVIIQFPLTGERIANALLFIGQVIVITTLIYLVVFALVAGVLMFITNYILIDKPFKMFDDNKPIEFDDELEETNDVTASFENADINGSSPVAQGATSVGSSDGSGEGQVVRKADELDDREKVFPGLSTMDVNYEGYVVEKLVSDELTLNEICKQFRNYLAKVEGLYFDEQTIRFFVSGFGTSHFMILEGLSGTGKSSLPRYFAKFLNAHLLFVPVQATWRDKSNLVGYFNDFSKTYTETEFLEGLYHANYNPDMIHIFVLDEMNISRVEYYFADFLSVLEYPEEDWKIKIMQLPYNFIPPAKLSDGVMQIPNNVYFVGTANKDDSTFTISDKVYDRAITIDFENRNDAFEVSEDVSTYTISREKLSSLFEEAKANQHFQLTESDLAKFQEICSFIYDQFDVTFGNRILNQISTIVPIYVACGGTKEEALDFLLSRKVISKIEGRFEEYVKGALRELLNLIQKNYGVSTMIRSEQTIKSLMRRL